jgi:hypothetical protein
MIEKNVFQSWHTHDLHPLVKEKIDSFKMKNPEYKFHLYTDDDMDNFVNEYFPGEIADCYNKLNIIVAKVDLWRYLVLFTYGGIYLDMDSSIECSLNDLIKDEDEAIITAERNPNVYVQWALIFAKQHPILKRTIELVINNIKNNIYPNDIHRMTGPTVYSRAINETHMKYFNNQVLNHAAIRPNTDFTFKTNDISYRIYGIDYNKHFCFEHSATKYLYVNKTYWRDEVKEKSLLKPDNV